MLISTLIPWYSFLYLEEMTDLVSTFPIGDGDGDRIFRATSIYRQRDIGDNMEVNVEAE